MRHLIFKQNLPLSIDEAWHFFSNPMNLTKITPAEMGFEILSGADTSQIFQGQIISYKVKPLWNLPMKWVTEITEVKPPYYFTDVQRKGPYALWQHEHHFRESGSGVEMTDILQYKLPLGFIGGLLDNLMIHTKVMEIFRYRKDVLEKIFPSPTLLDLQT